MEVHPPLLAAALHQLGLLPTGDLPMLAAHWLAQDLGGEHTADLAGRARRDVDVPELWALALGELHVPLPLTGVRRTAMVTVASQVTSGAQPVTWMVRLLWPTTWEGIDPDPDVDSLVHVLDDLQDWAVPIAAGAHWNRGFPVDDRDRDRAARAVKQMEAALAAMSTGDLTRAREALTQDD